MKGCMSHVGSQAFSTVLWVLFKRCRVTQKVVFVIMLPTEKRFVSELRTETRDCFSLPTKEFFFEKVPTEKRKRLGATHM